MQPYHDGLLYQGVETALHSEADGGHEWFAASPVKILDWFDSATPQPRLVVRTGPLQPARH